MTIYTLKENTDEYVEIEELPFGADFLHGGNIYIKIDGKQLIRLDDKDCVFEIDYSTKVRRVTITEVIYIFKYFEKI